MDYLLKSSAIIILFYGFYKLILQRETFFQLNRLFLISGIILAAIIPFIVIPIYVELQESASQNLIFTEVTNQQVIQNSINWIEIIQIIYLSGILYMIGKFIFNFLSLSNLIVKNSKIKKGDYIYIETEKNASPFSFFNYIVFNPNQFKKDELKQIIIHEKVHAKQYHSIDILISQVAIILFWFNPFIWLYKKEIEQNLEFIADEFAQQKTDCEKSYQKLLLKSSLSKNQLALTNNFYNSLIKKRIVMLHKNRSRNTNQWKYALIFPLITAFIFTFNTKTIAQNKSSENEIVIEENVQMTILTKDLEKSDFDKIKKNFSKEGITANFKNVKRNNKNEITAIEITLKSKQSNANYSIGSDKPIKPISISFDNNGDNITIGNSEIKGHKNGYVYVSNDGEHRVRASGKGNHFVVVDSEEGESSHEDNVYIIKSKGKGGKVKVIEIEENGDNDIEWISDKKNNSKVEIITEEDSKNVFVTDIDDEILYVIDGKKSSKEKMEKLSPSDIEQVNVLKGDSAVKKYGKKAKDGVVEITTKKKK